MDDYNEFEQYYESYEPDYNVFEQNQLDLDDFLGEYEEDYDRDSDLYDF
jgi:hypothetical protein